MKKVLSIMLIVLIAVAVMLTVTACTSCNKNTQMPELSLVIKGLTLGDNGEYRLNVGNAVETFSLKDVIQADRSTRFVISTDKAGENIVKDKATLTVGDNVFYVTASLGEATRIYTIRIRRLGSYTVSFDTDGGDDTCKQSCRRRIISNSRRVYQSWIHFCRLG